MSRRTIDEAFALLRENLSAYNDAVGEITDEAGIRMRAESMTIETPVELDVLVADDGTVTIGCAPPLYRVATGVAPVMHQLRFTATLESAAARENL